MSIRYSTGRRSRLKHSTAADSGPVAKAAPDYPRPRYSTSEDASIAHFTGRETDRRALQKAAGALAEEAKRAPASRSKR